MLSEDLLDVFSELEGRSEEDNSIASLPFSCRDPSQLYFSISLTLSLDVMGFVCLITFDIGKELSFVSSFSSS